MSTQVAAYTMNPAEDVIVFGDELCEGMWVLPEYGNRGDHARTEDEALRAQRFRKVTRLRSVSDPAYGGGALHRVRR